MTVLSGLQKLLSIFSSAQSAVRSAQFDVRNEGLCDFGQHKTMRYSHVTLDRRAGHALAVFDIETLDGKNVQAQVTAPQLGQALKSYPAEQHESASIRALREAAVVVQAEDSLLHKPSEPPAFTPRAF